MHTVTCTWAPPAPARVLVREGRRVWAVTPRDLGQVVGPVALARLRLRGTLTLTLFDDEWRALTGEPA
ncbi:hypothetical protein [Deinococcus budaensis]|uniref:Uncharacterized protein n=1 Tax=Deinococcus budaensis TaxID=1665626 RepID=A0A7W8GFM8_9DEIO|nr:hypothetical protein [Deinococcus budaensis]MBB5234789.1 hypothetical protein [Deinococcus budaensis]